MVTKQILIVTHYFPPHGGGIELVSENLIKQLSKRFDFQFVWFASSIDRPPGLLNRTRFVGIPTCNFMEAKFGVPYPIWNPVSIVKLWREIQKSSLVHVHDYVYMGNLLACIFGFIQKKPVVITQHVGFVPFNNRIYRFLLSLLNRTIGAWLLGRADQVVFVSHTVLSYFIRFVNFTRKPLVIANGVDLELFHPASYEQRQSIRKLFMCEDENPILLFVGRFVEKKGLPILKELAKRLPHCHFIMVGHGSIDPSSWNLENLHVLKNLPQEKLVPLYQATDLLVLPSKGEGFPLVIQEAMACGTPALVGTESAAAFNFESGLIHSADVDTPDTISIWQTKVESILKDRWSLDQSRMIVADFAKSKWSWENCSEAYAHIINRLLNKSVDTA